MSVATALDFREPLAEAFEKTAQFRRAKAEEYPEDARNARSAEALDRAAAYVRSLDANDRGLNHFADFAYELSLWTRTDLVAEDPYAIGFGEDAMARFFFNGERDRPRAGDFARLIRDVHQEMLEGWRETMEEGDLGQPPRGLVIYFEGNDVPLYGAAASAT